MLSGRKQLGSRFNFIYRDIDAVLSINIPEVDNYLHNAYHVELDIKDTVVNNISASYLDLHLLIGRDDQLHTSHFRANVTISISMSRTIVYLSRILYDMPGLAPDINVVFWGQPDFPISFLNRDTSKNASKVSLKSFYSWDCDLIKEYEDPLSRMLNDTL